MWAFKAPAAVVGLAVIAFFPVACAKPYPVHIEEIQAQHNASQIAKRQCEGTQCGYYNQLCCAVGESCLTDANNQAVCSPSNGQQPTASWQTAAPQATYACRASQNTCGTGCCDSGYYCASERTGECRLIAGGSSGGIIGTLTPSAPLRPTSSILIIVTATGTPTATVPFETPIATGVNGTLVESGQSGSGLSGGAIAGIVIGVILGVMLLLLLCLFCCAKSLFDTILACLGIGRKRKHTHEETYVESHHHSSGVGAGGGGRRWYGQGPARPSRPSKGGGLGGAAGVAGVLGGLALALGLKRRHDRKHDDKSTTISGSSAYYSDYTTSESSASSDRHTRHTQRSSRR